MHAFQRGAGRAAEAAGSRDRGHLLLPLSSRREAWACYRCDSPLRKPRPGMLLQAAAEHDLDLAASFAIGDKKSDVLAGQAAGCRTILVQTGEAGRQTSRTRRPARLRGGDLLAAAQWIERAASR